MSNCTFFGHRDCFGLDKEQLEKVIISLIDRGVDTFYVGDQGEFDSIVYECLSKLKTEYPKIKYSVVLAYMPTKQNSVLNMNDTIYPEIEGHPKFAIERRNLWMIKKSDYCICYINSSISGAYKFVNTAKRKGIVIFNLGKLEI